jgi:hypothetical protein
MLHLRAMESPLSQETLDGDFEDQEEEYLDPVDDMNQVDELQSLSAVQSLGLSEGPINRAYTRDNHWIKSTTFFVYELNQQSCQFQRLMVFKLDKGHLGDTCGY